LNQTENIFITKSVSSVTEENSEEF